MRKTASSIKAYRAPDSRFCCSPMYRASSGSAASCRATAIFLPGVEAAGADGRSCELLCARKLDLDDMGGRLAIAVLGQAGGTLEELADCRVRKVQKVEGCEVGKDDVEDVGSWAY